MEWCPAEPESRAVKMRACLEALAFLLARAVREHEDAGQKVTRVTVSGGMAKSQLMCEILASALDRPLERLVSDEGPALGGAVAALAGLESYRRKQQGIADPYTAADAVAAMVKFRDRVPPRPEWVPAYARGQEAFERWLNGQRRAERTASYLLVSFTVTSAFLSAWKMTRTAVFSGTSTVNVSPLLFLVASALALFTSAFSRPASPFASASL